jgi:hypothetical protein
MVNSLKKIIKNRDAFLTDEAIIKILYTGLRNVSKRNGKKWLPSV